jgi:hypothetical protein
VAIRPDSAQRFERLGKTESARIPLAAQGEDCGTARDLSAFFIHSIHFSFPFSTVFHLTLAGTARYFN